MNASDTPRTDGNLIEYDTMGWHGPLNEWVEADFARTLEREIATLTERLQRCDALLAKCRPALDENDKLRDHLHIIQRGLELVANSEACGGPVRIMILGAINIAKE